MFSSLEPVEMSFTVAASAATLRTEIVRALTAKGGRIPTDGGSEVVAKFGSNLKVRLLGAFLAGFNATPRDVIVSMKESGGQTQVSITVRDTFGFGTRIGVAKKMRAVMQNDASSLQDELAKFLPPSRPG